MESDLSQLVTKNCLNETIQSVHAHRNGVDVLENFTYPGRAAQNNGGLHQEVLGQICLPCGVMESLSQSCGVADICAGQRSGYLDHLCSLSYTVNVKHAQNSD